MVILRPDRRESDPVGSEGEHAKIRDDDGEPAEWGTRSGSGSQALATPFAFSLDPPIGWVGEVALVGFAGVRVGIWGVV